MFEVGIGEPTNYCNGIIVGTSTNNFMEAEVVKESTRKFMSTNRCKATIKTDSLLSTAKCDVKIMVWSRLWPKFATTSWSSGHQDEQFCFSTFTEDTTFTRTHSPTRRSTTRRIQNGRDKRHLSSLWSRASTCGLGLRQKLYPLTHAAVAFFFT